MGVRPEKIRLGHGEENSPHRPSARDRLRRRRHAVRAPDERGNVSVYVQNSEPGATNRRRARSRGAQTPRSSSIPRREPKHDRPADQAAAARAGSDRRSRDHAFRHPRRLRQQRHEGPAEPRRRAEAREQPALLELDPLHRHEQQDELTPVARRVPEEVRRQRRLRRGHQRQRLVLREDPGPALARPVGQPRHHRPDRQRPLPRADAEEGLGREARQVGDPEHEEPGRRPEAPELRPEPRLHACRGSRA